MRFRPGRALILLAAALVLGFAARSEGPAVFVSRLAWTMAGDHFGGWSGLEIDADGSAFTAITDRGFVIDGRLRRSSAGRLAGIEAGPIRRLGDSADGFFGGDDRDAEGLALAPDGRMFVAFEGVRRVLTYADTGGGEAAVLPIHPDFIAFYSNEAQEALAIGPDGALYTLPETVVGGGPWPVYRFDGTGWAVVARLPERGAEFHPVGADIGPDGRFYLLERKLVERIGFVTRVRRWDMAGGEFKGEALLLVTRPGTHDNLEGLAVWPDPAGGMRLTMVADDNFGRYQSTEVVEYRVRD